MNGRTEARRWSVAVILVTLAGCDGGGQSGRVVDAITGIGIFGIQVACRGGGDTESTLSGLSGEFSFDAECASFVATDFDGPANGSYTGAVVPATDGATLRLTPL